jgi:hypothetical protein
MRDDIDEVREQILREHFLLRAADVRVTLQRVRLLIADYRMEQKFHRMMRAIKANFNPAQPRVPAGRSEGGQWTDGGNDSWNRLRAEFARSDGINDSRVLADADPEPLISSAQYTESITGFTRHGINQAINRGVSPLRILDAVRNPMAIQPQSNGTTRYIGQSCVVVLNPLGGVVTCWGTR